MKAAEIGQPMKVGRLVWAVTDFSVSREVGLPEGAVLRCDIEVIEQKKQFYRSFTLFYMGEWFEAWECREEDCETIAQHARQWLVEELGKKRPGADFSCHSCPGQAHIFI